MLQVAKLIDDLTRLNDSLLAIANNRELSPDERDRMTRALCADLPRPEVQEHCRSQVASWDGGRGDGSRVDVVCSQTYHLFELTRSRTSLDAEWATVNHCLAEHLCLLATQLQDEYRRQKPAPNAMPDQPAIDREAILQALGTAHPKLLNNYDLETLTSISRKTVGARITRLIGCGLCERPNGQRGGVRLSAKGKHFVDALAAH